MRRIQRVRPLDAGIREMLKPVTEVVAPLRPEAHARADVLAELEARAEALVSERSIGKKVKPDARFEVRAVEAVLLQPENRREPDLEKLFIETRRRAPAWRLLRCASTRTSV